VRAIIWNLVTNRRFQFNKRSQLFIRTYNKALAVAAMRSATKIVRPRESIAETQPQLQPALLRLLAIIGRPILPLRIGLKSYMRLFGIAGKIILDYVIRRFNAPSAQLKSGLDLR
jgi:hypothetical protein